MQEIVDMMRWTLDRSNLKIEFIKDGEETHYLNFDKRRLQQVLLNLLSNAIKFSTRGTISIYLKVHASSDELEVSNTRTIKVSVLDQGIGMSPDDC